MFQEMAKFNERLATSQGINAKESENHKRIVSKLTNENRFLLEEINNLRRQVAYLTSEQSSFKARLCKISSAKEIQRISQS
jgi:predicted RNase H-like nuclease (RuvC/YqgF family)